MHDLPNPFKRFVLQLATFCGKVIEIVSGEWLLTWLELPNGGAIVLLRSVSASIVVSLLGLAIQNILDPMRTMSFSCTEFAEQLSSNVRWFGAILGAVYAAFYARFASQWSYLAGLYNQIKATECYKDCNLLKLADWKAGFIVDAEELHLANKPLFAEVIKAWRTEPAVEAAYQCISESTAQQEPSDAW
jgi:hypothetical protein